MLFVICLFSHKEEGIQLKVHLKMGNQATNQVAVEEVYRIIIFVLLLLCLYYCFKLIVCLSTNVFRYFFVFSERGRKATIVSTPTKRRKSTEGAPQSGQPSNQPSSSQGVTEGNISCFCSDG